MIPNQLTEDVAGTGTQPVQAFVVERQVIKNIFILVSIKLCRKQIIDSIVYASNNPNSLPNMFSNWNLTIRI